MSEICTALDDLHKKGVLLINNTLFFLLFIIFSLIIISN
jgi:hypothetical protein